MNQPESEELSKPEGAELSPGSLLRAAREARGMGLSDIAHALKFSERQIDALENDLYDQLPGAPFVRGFVRSYARLVKIDAAPLIERLQQISPPSSVEVVAPQNMGDAAPPASMARYARPAMAVLALLVVAIAVYFWSGGFPEPGGSGSKETRHELVSPKLAATMAEPSPVPATASSVSATAGTGHRLVFDFDDKSWLEVKDANNAIILTGEFPRGSHQEVTGAAPFQLWVGNAPVVRVSLDDRGIDLQPYSREGVARLTVD